MPAKVISRRCVLAGSVGATTALVLTPMPARARDPKTEERVLECAADLLGGNGG